MKKHFRTILTVFLTLTLLGSFSVFMYKSAEARSGEETYSEARELAEAPDTSAAASSAEKPPEVLSIPDDGPTPWREAPVLNDPFMDELRKTDLNALRQVNGDVLAWIVIPDTDLAYPLMYSGDNEYYLNHTWKKEASAVGSIFLEQYCSTDLSDFNTIVYGHRMTNTSMFGSLKFYSKQDYWNSHPYVYIYDDNGAHRYEIFAAYEAPVAGSTYRLGTPDDEYKQACLNDWLNRSVLDTGITPTVNDRILTMSTCTGNGYDTRWVVQARLAAAVNQAG